MNATGMDGMNNTILTLILLVPWTTVLAYFAAIHLGMAGH